MILAIDQGTTSTTAMVFDESAEPLGRETIEFPQHFPQPGWVEHDLDEVWDSVQAAIAAALENSGVAPADLQAIGITNQRETVCAWDPASGRALHRAVVWQDRRTAARCRDLRDAGLQPLLRRSTGLMLDPYFSATKMEWLLEHVEGLRERAADGRAALGTVDAWLVHRLTGELVTDPSNASRTLLYDLAAGGWSTELLALFSDIPERALARVATSSGEIGRTRPELLGGARVPVAGVAGDQQAALFGQACLQPGRGKATYGTGSFVLVNTGTAPPQPGDGLVATVAWGIGHRRDYALEASIFVTGAAVQWLRDGLGIIASAQETAELAGTLQSNEGVYFVPALTGLGSPHWDPHARGTILGLTRGSGRAHLARATLEAIAYQTVDALGAMKDAGAPALEELRVDGGATANPWLMAFQADVLGVPVVVPEIAETTALGAAYLAGVGVGLWTLDDVGRSARERVRYEPRLAESERAELLEGWSRALDRARDWDRG